MQVFKGNSSPIPSRLQKTKTTNERDKVAGPTINRWVEKVPPQHKIVKIHSITSIYHSEYFSCFLVNYLTKISEFDKEENLLFL